MKTNKLMKIGGIALVLGVIAAVLIGVDYTDIMSFLGIGSGLTMAVAGSGTVDKSDTLTTDDIEVASSELLTMSIRENIVKMRPSQTPVDTILRQMGTNVPIKSWESKYYAVDHRGFVDAVATATGSSGTAAAEGATFALYVDNIHYWNVDDTGVIVDVTGYAGTGDFVFHVSAVTAATQLLTCVAVNGLGTNGADNPNITIDDVVIRMGNSKKEEDAQTGRYAVLPQPVTNYCQRFMAQVEETVFATDHLKEVKWDIEDYRLQALYDFRLAQELTILFGAKGRKLIGSDYYHHMNGITKLVTGTTTYTDGTMVTDDLYTWAKDIFSGNSGSQMRYVFGGGDFIAQMSALEPVQKQMNASNTETVYGVTFSKVVTNFGTLYVMHHDLLNSIGWDKKALVLDMAFIEKHTWMPLKTTKLDLIKTGTRNANAYVIDETYTVATRYPATHKIIQPA